jgi:hypothetical protein
VEEKDQLSPLLLHIRMKRSFFIGSMAAKAVDEDVGRRLGEGGGGGGEEDHAINAAVVVHGGHNLFRL